RRERQPLSFREACTHSSWKMVISQGAIRSASFRPITMALAKTPGSMRSMDGPLPRMKIVSVANVDAILATWLEKLSIIRLSLNFYVALVLQRQHETRQQIPGMGTAGVGETSKGATN